MKKTSAGSEIRKYSSIGMMIESVSEPRIERDAWIVANRLINVQIEGQNRATEGRH